MAFHALSMFLVKIFTSEEFKEDRNTYNKLLHVVENINCSLPYKDWDEDEGRSNKKEEFTKRFKKTECEMIVSQQVNIGFSMIMLIPLWFTDYKINLRHTLLTRCIGAKKEEEDSLSNCNTLMITVTVCMIVFSILEVAMYLLYNRKYHPWVKIITGEVVNYDVKNNDDEESCCCSCFNFCHNTKE